MHKDTAEMVNWHGSPLVAEARSYLTGMHELTDRLVELDHLLDQVGAAESTAATGQFVRDSEVGLGMTIDDCLCRAVRLVERLGLVVRVIGKL